MPQAPAQPVETSPREGRRVRRPIPDTERGRPRRGYIEDSSTAAQVNRCTVLDCWPRRTPRQDACAGSRPAVAYGALKIRQTAPKAEDRSSMAVPRTAGRPPHSVLARTGPGGPGEQALRRRKPGAEPTSALQMADSKPRHPWMTRHTFAGSPPTSSPMVQPLSAAFGALGSEATGRRRRRRGLARPQGTPCVLVWRPLGLAGKRSRSDHAPAP
jgi:hypothetical protein